VTKPLPFTESTVRRAISGARKAGLQVNAVSIAPDGTVTVFEGLENPSVTIDDDAERRKWTDIEA
jgi:hypothetical protein